MITTIERILILAKTNPSPSAQYMETSCVAGINDQGEMRRLYPIPFRLLEKDSQFKKWQWINARVHKSTKDNRSESYRIYVDTIKCGSRIDTKSAWRERRTWIDKLPNFTSFDVMELARKESGTTLALLRPTNVSQLDIVKAKNQDWTDEEREKLLREQLQGNLFDEPNSKREIRELRKIPFDFYYRYTCEMPDGCRIEHKHKITDWETGAFYWKCKTLYGVAWEEPFRKKLEQELPSKDLMFVMGTIHRFPDQWLIISLIYPPKPSRVGYQEILQF